MSSIRLEAFLARLYVDSDARANFKANPRAQAKKAGLSDEQSTALENLDWIGHAIMDAEMRILCGLEPVKDPKIPFYIFDAANAANAGKPPQLSTGYGNAYQAGYAKQWKLEK